MIPKKNQEVELRRFAIYTQRTDIAPEFIKKISIALNVLLADVFCFVCEDKEFPLAHERPSLRDYHLLLDEQGEQLFAMTDDTASAARAASF